MVVEERVTDHLCFLLIFWSVTWLIYFKKHLPFLYKWCITCVAFILLIFSQVVMTNTQSDILRELINPLNVQMKTEVEEEYSLPLLMLDSRVVV